MRPPKLHDVPVRTVTTVDYEVIATHVKEHGFMLMKAGEDFNYNASHATLHRRFNLGLRKVWDERGNQIGWRVEPARKHKNPRQAHSQKELSS